MLDIDYVITIHDEIIKNFGGLPGHGRGGVGAIESALARVQSHVLLRIFISKMFIYQRLPS